MRQSVSSQKHSRSASEPRRARRSRRPPVRRRRGRRARGRSPARRGGPGPARSPTPGARPSRGALERREDVVARLALLRGDHADRARQQRAGRSFCGSSRPSASSCLRRRSIRASRSPSPATRRSADGEGEARRGGGAAGVVVAAAGHDDLHALGGCATGTGDHHVPVPAPGGAGQRAGGVAQLEVDARPRGAQVDQLADDLHAREGAQLRAQRARVLAHRERPREAAVGDAGVRLLEPRRARPQRRLGGLRPLSAAEERGL